MLFDVIYDYLYSIFNSTYISNYSCTIMGVSTSLASWLSITITIIILILLFLFCCKVVVWCFKLFYNSFRSI